MRNISLFFGVCVVAGLLASARPAAADLAPEGFCAPAKLGERCDEAVDESGDVVGDGICVAEQCTRATPNGPMTYDCVMCRPESGAGGAGGNTTDPMDPVAGADNGPTTTGGSVDAPEPTAGSAGATTTTGGSASTAGTSSTTPAKPDAKGSDDGGCSVRTGATRTGLASAASLLILGLALRRRRARPSAR